MSARASCCLYRHAGKPKTCGRDKKNCRWYRAAWCISVDVVCAAVQGFYKMILGGND